MLRVRRLEEQCVELYSAAKIRGFLHVYIGEEAVAAGVMSALAPEDAVVATYREHGHALLRGVSAGAILAEMYGKVEGCCRGRGGSMHLFDAATRFYGGNAIVAGGLPLAVGLALADKIRPLPCDRLLLRRRRRSRRSIPRKPEPRRALAAAGPVLLREQPVRHGHRLARSESQTDLPSRRPATRIASGPRTDGCARRRRGLTPRRDAVRAGGGPHFLELRTYRFRAHSMFDPERYREKTEVSRWMERDPINMLRNALETAGQLTEKDWKKIQQDVDAEDEGGVEFAEGGTLEPVEELTRFVYSERAPK